MFVHFQSDHLPSLKLTANARENKNDTQKETRKSSNHPFSGAFAVSFREGK